MSSPSEPVRFLSRDVPDFSDEILERCAAETFGVEGDLRRLDSERDVTAVVAGDNGPVGVLKVSNADEDPGVVDMQIKALRWIEAQDPNLPVPRVVPTRSGEASTHVTAEDGCDHIVRMVSFLPGTILEADPSRSTARLRHHLGTTMARLDRALSGFFHPAAAQNHPWDIMRAGALRPYTKHIAEPGARANAESVLDRFVDIVVPAVRGLRHQIIHQDAHIGNLLVDASRPDEIVGIIDFGDMLYGPLVCEIAVAADPDHRSTDIAETLADVAWGFDNEIPLEPEEADLLPDLVLTRLALTVTVMAARAALTPDQPPYVGVEGTQWRHMEKLLATGRRDLQRRLRRSLSFPVSTGPEGVEVERAEVGRVEAESQALWKRRVDVLGAHSPTFYAEPLHFEHSRGAWLYAADGSRYLDFYNNVPQVGHGHPAVVKAVARQMAALNTNTRYLYEPVVAYAERLVAALSDDLDTCLFVNSGSEANDVAVQIAKAVTGNTGAVITENAYHGITESTRRLSPSGSRQPLPGDVVGLIRPDPYRGSHRAGEAQLAELYADDADRGLRRLAEQGLAPALFMVDTAMCSDGIPSIPSGYLNLVASQVRQVGGLVIADEVQAGFGRLGGMWGHEVRGMGADIVTMGKPVANGHPLGVVVTRRAILERFSEQRPLFSTFGGNPVSSAAGMAVLDVIEQEDLIATSAATGDYLRSRLKALSGIHELIGDVRGSGMLTGVEFVSDRIEKTPATVQTGWLVEALKIRGVLVGRDGPDDNVLKLRPPLVVTEAEVDVFTEALADSLRELEAIGRW